MKLLLWVLVFAMALPVLLVAVALGPVTVGVLCAVGFGFIVAASAISWFRSSMPARGSPDASGDDLTMTAGQ